MIDLQAWVESEDQPDRKIFRQAVQLILRGIAQSPILSSTMIMKGGVLLAIRYQSSRFTRDIDFSTSQKIQDVDIPALLSTIKEALVPISADNEYALALRLQSHEIRPPNRPGVSFPTLQMRIGYVSRLEPRSVKRLEATGSAQVVQVDYSFNEWASETEKESIDGGSLSMYTFHDLVAEKLRSVLQQPIRERGRYQDIYDLFLLLQIGHPPEEADREAVFRKLLEACREPKCSCTELRCVTQRSLSFPINSIVPLYPASYQENCQASILLILKYKPSSNPYRGIQAFHQIEPGTGSPIRRRAQ